MTATIQPGLSRTSSAVRLAVATKAMAAAETLEAAIAAKDKAKDLGLMPRDMDALRAAFVQAKARFR